MPNSDSDRIYQEADEVQRARKLVGSHADDVRSTRAHNRGFGELGALTIIPA